MEILVRDSFVEYPEDVARQWGAIVVAKVGEQKIRGQYPPVPGTPGARTAAEALQMAGENLNAVAASLGADIASIVEIHAA